MATDSARWPGVLVHVFHPRFAANHLPRLCADRGRRECRRRESLLSGDVRRVWVPPLLWPQIRSVPAAIYPDENAWWAGLLDGLAGLTAALVFWQINDAIRSRKGTEWPSFAGIGWMAAVGIVLSWQRSIYTLPITASLLVLAVRGLRWLYARNCRQSSSCEQLKKHGRDVGATH